jgi:hypothetical protein
MIDTVSALLPDGRPTPAGLSCRGEDGALDDPTSFRKTFYIIGNDNLRWVSFTYALQVL